MNENLENKLYESFGEYFTFNSYEGTNGYIPLECNDGWFQIIWDMCEKLDKTDSTMRFLQIKEKYGSLRVYYCQSSSDIDEEVVDRSEKLSEITCELCGKPGKIENNHGWFKCYCLDCWNKFN